MDTLLVAFLVASLTAIGDRSHLFALELGQRADSVPRIIAGMAIAASLNISIAAFGGMMMADMLNVRSANLLTGLAIIFAGSSGLFNRQKPALRSTPHQPLGLINITSRFFMLGFGDKISFLTFALTARMEQPLLAGIGATVGIVAAHSWPILLGPEWPTIMPLRMASRVIGFVSLLVGLMIAIFALCF